MGLVDPARRFPWGRFLKFGAVGVSGMGVSYGVYIPATRMLGVLHEAAYVAALLVSILTNFLLNEAWTFRDRGTGGAAGFAGRLVRFYLVSLGGAAINWVVFYVCFRKFGMYDLIAMLVGIAVATAWNFLVNLAWTWRKPA